MVKYVIEEAYLKNGVKLYCLDDIISQKRPNLGKYQFRFENGAKRALKTWDMLGPMDKMNDRMG